MINTYEDYFNYITELNSCFIHAGCKLERKKFYLEIQELKNKYPDYDSKYEKSMDNLIKLIFKDK